MKESYIAKINKIGKIGGIITKITRVFICTGMIVLIIAMTAVLISPAKSINISTDHRITITYDTVNNSFGLAGITDSAGDRDLDFEINGIEYDNFKFENTLTEFKATATSDKYTFALSDTVWILALAVLTFIVFIVTLHFLQKLCNLMAVCETPFTVEIANLIQKLAYCFVPVMILTGLTENITTGLLSTGSVDIVLGFDLTMVLVVLMVLMLSHIFRYGAMLQQESDETL